MDKTAEECLNKNYFDFVCQYYWHGDRAYEYDGW